MKARYPDFYAKARARLEAEFHGREVAARARFLGPGRWPQLVVQIDVELSGDVHGCKLLRSSGFNGLDEEGAGPPARRSNSFSFPPKRPSTSTSSLICPCSWWSKYAATD